MMGENATLSSLVAAGLAMAVLAYTYVVYPALLVVLRRSFPLRVSANPDWTPMVSACIAAHNAEKAMDDKLASLAALDYPRERLEILVYSDGSTDRTEEIVHSWARRDPRIHLVSGTVRRGKPTALNCLRRLARGEVLLLTDSRQPLASCSLRTLIALLADPSVGCVTGNLVVRGRSGSGAYWRYENWIRRNEANFRSMVGMTGPLSVVRAVDLAPLPPNLILDDVWIPMRLRLEGRRIVFCEDAVAFDEAFEDEREFGRKVRTLAGNYQIFSWMPELLVPLVNPSWFETVSHKVMRLLCPWALSLLFVASFLGVWQHRVHSLGYPILLSLFAGQVAFYISALAGERMGRVGVLARTFVVLNAAAVVGLWRFLTNSQKVTW